MLPESVLTVALLNVTVDPVPVNVPAVKFQFPPSEMALALVLNVPSVLVKAPLMSSASWRTTLPADLLMTRLVKLDPFEVMFLRGVRAGERDGGSSGVESSGSENVQSRKGDTHRRVVEIKRSRPLITTLLVTTIFQLLPVSKVFRPRSSNFLWM